MSPCGVYEEGADGPGSYGGADRGVDTGRPRIVEHVGSGPTEADLGVLLKRARELLANPAQGVFEPGIEPAPPVKGLLAPAGDAGLFDLARTAALSGRAGHRRRGNTFNGDPSGAGRGS